MATLSLRGDSITLAQAVKVAGIAATGGQAKVIIREGEITVNGTVETRPARKLKLGDRFQTPDGNQWTVGE
jgi:ribosome-associated protein